MWYRAPFFKTISCTRAYFSRDVCLYDIFAPCLFVGSLNVREIFFGSGRVHDTNVLAGYLF